MLPTPSTSHVNFEQIYEPSEDSFLLLDTLSSPSEIQFLTDRFGDEDSNTAPLIVEVGTGSGVVLAFVTANAHLIFGRSDVLTIGTDVNAFAAQTARQTVLEAQKHIHPEKAPIFLDTITTDLLGSLRHGSVDVLMFNPPYVPTADVLPLATDDSHIVLEDGASGLDLFARDSHLLSLSYAGGVDGMEVTNRLIALLPDVLNPVRGVAYILLCHQNKPEAVEQRLRNWGPDWSVSIVAHLEKKGGWEKLCILRVARVTKTCT